GDKGKALSPTKWGKGPPRSGVGGDPRRGRVERALQQARLLTIHHSGPPTSDLRLSAAGGFGIAPYLPPPQATAAGTFPLRCRSGGQGKGLAPHEGGEGAPAKRGRGRPWRGRVERALQQARLLTAHHSGPPTSD